MVATSDEACQEAVEWVTDFEAKGSTCTLVALQQAFQDTDVEGIYLLTDGKPVSSHSIANAAFLRASCGTHTGSPT